MDNNLHWPKNEKINLSRIYLLQFNLSFNDVSAFNSHNLRVKVRKKGIELFLFWYNRQGNSFVLRSEVDVTVLWWRWRTSLKEGSFFYGSVLWNHLTWKFLTLQVNYRNVPVRFNPWRVKSRNGRSRWRCSVHWIVNAVSWSWFASLCR